MIRGWLCLVVIIIATALASPALPNSSRNYSPTIHYSAPVANPDPLNVTGASTAFNYTLSAANIFTNATAKEIPAVNSTQFKWFSTINETGSGAHIQGTAFNYTASPIPAAASQKVAWNLTIPKTSCSTCSTFISFTLFGSLTLGTNETFTVKNATTSIESGIFKGINATQLSICSLASTSNATVCGPTVQVTVPNKYLGSTLTLTFQFMGNATGGGKIKTSVGEVVVESLDNTIKNSDSNFIVQTGSPSIVTHTSRFLKVRYNATSTPISWTNEVLNVYYPSGYNLTAIQMNSTIPVFPITSHVPFEKNNCNPPGTVPCRQGLLAINMSDISGYPVLHNSTITLTSITANSMRSLSTLSGGVATQFFTAGDNITVRLVNVPSIKNDTLSHQTGNLTISFSSQLSIQNSTVSTTTGGDYTFTLPSSCTGSSVPICNQKWTVSAVFKSHYDIGNSTTTFRIDLLQVTSFSSTGGSNSLSVQGTIQYGNGTAANNLNTTLFAIDQGITAGNPSTTYAFSHPTSHLYISNVTIVNGAFAPGQSLTMLITVVNPNATQAFNATLTIEHDWPGPQRHNMTVSIFLGLGDTPLGDFAFTNSTARTFRVTISFTGAGVQAVVKSLFSGNPTSPKTFTQGTSPVLPNRPHAGLFNFTITSTINNNIQGLPISIQSPTYAYIPSSLAPARYLYASPAPFLTNATGSFSQTISSISLLGAKNLTVFVLARDPNGIVVVNNLPSTGFTDSTTLVANADSIGPVAKSQTATATLHLTSNATRTNGITEDLTVVLTLQGNGLSARTAATKSGVIISPGATVTIPLTFTAPNSTGSYSLTFSSPEYGGILTSQTLQVTIVSTSLQLLIPAAIGVVAAIIILGVYLVRGKSSSEGVEEKTKTKGAGPKPKPTTTAGPPAKSLTRTEDADK